jgi:DNA-binding transcriptional ArsR family regulator
VNPPDPELADPESIDYRRSSMDVTRDEAETWAPWFRALGDPSRIMILNLLATAGRAMSVGEMVDVLDLAQSTVSHHLKVLSEVGFLLVERDGTNSWWRMNERCLSCFPSAAEVVMGHVPAGVVPWGDPVRSRRSRS